MQNPGLKCCLKSLKRERFKLLSIFDLYDADPWHHSDRKNQMHATAISLWKQNLLSTEIAKLGSWNVVRGNIFKITNRSKVLSM